MADTFGEVIDEGCRPEDSPYELLVSLLDNLQPDDSFGVPGSDFRTCLICGAGGSPYIEFKHEDDCIVDQHERRFQEWQEWSVECADFSDGSGI